MAHYRHSRGGGYRTAAWWITARDHRGNTASSSAIILNEVDVWDEGGIDRTDQNAALPVARTGTSSASNCVVSQPWQDDLDADPWKLRSTYTISVAQPNRAVAIVAPTSSNRGVMNGSVDGGGAYRGEHLRRRDR